MRKIHLFALALVVGMIVPQALVAQTQFGTVSGRVADASEAVIPGATVTLTNRATNVSMETQTNPEGLFVFGNVAAGEYDIVVAKEGFRRFSQRILVEVARRVNVDLVLEVGLVTEVVTVTETREIINTVSGDLSKTLTPREVTNLPLLTRNPYALVGLAPGASDTGTVSGDTRGLGLAIQGARTSSVNFMLDGGENNDTFVAGVGQAVPLDAVHEIRIQTNSMTAEFGRNRIVTNVITKSGSNALHGSLWEFYRGAGLSTVPFDDNASGTPKSNFVRHQFGATAGGPVSRDKTFFFGSLEGIRVRSKGTARFFVPTQEFMNASSSFTQDFINAFGGIPQSDPSVCLTADDISVIENGVVVPDYLTNFNTGNPVPGNTPLFCRTTLRAPIDAGGGFEQNTWLFTGRVDHHFGPSTALMGRYAFSQERFPDGSVSLSPYQGFDTGFESRNQNFNLTLTHSFTPTMFSETRGTFNRIFQLQPLGEAPSTTPCWFYDNAFNTPTGEQIVFPGYVPDVCVFAGIPFGGPQNVYQGFQGFTWARGKHTFKWGGQYVHLRDNRTFGAFQNAFIDTFIMQGFLDGQTDFIFVAIDPKGKVPGDSYSVATDGPFVPPSFTRHFRYNEVAWYFEDSIKLTPRFTLTAGVRWEYFGVLHSPNNERFLDANLFLNAVGLPGAEKSIFEQVRDARFSRTGKLFRSDFNNFGPRFGFAYDIRGNARTVLRGGYGIFYDRNFGNALFNVIQNPPNYFVVSLLPLGSFGFENAPIFPNQFDTLAELAGASLRLSGSARMLDEQMATAYSPQWNVTLEHDIFGKGVIGSVSYVGTNGIKLYSLNNLNQRGSCLLAPTVNAVCDPAGSRLSRLNQTGLTGMNRRGNEGLSRYHGMSAELRARNLGTTGLTIGGSYTWSHSIDNSSSFFGDSPFEAFFGFGFRQAYRPALDRANSTNDIRHQMSMSWDWEIPWGKGMGGVGGQVLGGWQFSGIFSAQTGAAFTIYDGSSLSQCNNDGTNFCYPVLTGPVPSRTETPHTTPNSFIIYDVSNTFTTQQAHCGGDLTCTAELNILSPELLSPRNLFRTPGVWFKDIAILKNFRLPREGMGLQFRAEFFNVYNHSNLYVVPGTNQFTGAGSQIIGNKGLPVGGGKERRNIQLALKLNW